MTLGPFRDVEVQDGILMVRSYTDEDVWDPISTGNNLVFLSVGPVIPCINIEIIKS